MLDNRIFHSRPRAEADWNCPRYRYLSYHYDGIGLNANEESFDQFFGTTQHDGLAFIATQHRDNKGDVDIDLVAEAAGKQVRDQVLAETPGTDEFLENFSNEQACLAEGLLRGFYKHQWPILIREYPKLLAIEADVSFRHDSNGDSDPKGQFEFLSKPDLVQATDDESEVIYREYKASGSSQKIKWINSWDRTIQVHATQNCIEQTLGIKPTGCIIHGLYRGYESYGKLSTVMAYAYHKQGQPPFTRTETAYEYRGGLKRYPVWLLDGGIKKWVAEMPDHILMEQYPVTPVIFPSEAITKRFFRQRAAREFEIASRAHQLAELDLKPEHREAIMDSTFPQHTHKCKPAWGFECPMQVICFGDVDPLKAGFTYRTVHHEAEIASIEESES